MYKITPEMAKYLLQHAKDTKIPGLISEDPNPLTPKNIHSIGLIDPQGAIGTDLDFLIEQNYSVPQQEIQQEHGTEISGFWLYKKNELTFPSEPISVLRKTVDPYFEVEKSNDDEEIDISDCFVVLPSIVDKLTCTNIGTLERLFELEPTLENCLDACASKLFKK